MLREKRGVTFGVLHQRSGLRQSIQSESGLSVLPKSPEFTERIARARGEIQMNAAMQIQPRQSQSSMLHLLQYGTM
jgi:hypothetical protein